MKYCGNIKCTTTGPYIDRDNFCEICGTELTPFIECACGKSTYNPRQRVPLLFCTYCGAKWTEDYLSQCMKVQLGKMVDEIVKTHDAQCN